MGGQQGLVLQTFMEECEAKEHGHDSKQRHQVEGQIMQAKEWMRGFGRCHPWSTLAQRSQSEDESAGRNRSQGGHEATKALCLCARICSPEPPRLSHPSQVCFGQQNTS
jgi:hypothetical protein